MEKESPHRHNVAVQHETDHLNGVLFIDRFSAARKLGLKRRLRHLMEDWEEDKI